MENVENVTTTTNSDLSQYTAAPLEVFEDASDSMTKTDVVESDKLDLTDRLMNVLVETSYVSLPTDSLPFGTGYPLDCLLNPLLCFKKAPALKQPLSLYAAFRYESIDIVISFSSPKGLAGGGIVGWFPYTEWYNPDSLNDLRSIYNANDQINMISLMNSMRDASVFSLDLAQDVKFTIPWTFSQSFLVRDYVDSMMTYVNNGDLWPGTPLVYMRGLSARTVSGSSNSTPIRVFARFNGLQWYLPIARDNLTQKQSGLEAPMALAADFMADSAASALAGAAASLGLPFYSEPGTMSSPKIVTPSYSGDTASTAPPDVPIFQEWQEPAAPKHSVLEYLTQPQYIGSTTTGPGFVTTYVNPFNAKFGDGPSNPPTWLRFFSMLNYYWRGSLKLDFLIFGHPTAEVYHQIKLNYPGIAVNLSSDMSVNPIAMGTSNGFHRVSVTVPYARACDFTQVLENGNTDQYSSASVSASFEVINYMLDTAPVFDVCCFISAGDDFCLYQPYAPGYNNVISSGVEKQILLPKAHEIFHTRSLPVHGMPVMPSCENVEDYMRIWSRAIPFLTKDTNGEPIPDLSTGLTNASWLYYDTAIRTNSNDNSIFQSYDYIALLSRLFCFYRGSIGAKIMIDSQSDDSDVHHYRYVELIPRLDSKLPTHTPYSFGSTEFPNANLGNGMVITPSGLQPVIDVTIPYRSNYAWSPTSNYIPKMNAISKADILDVPLVAHNIVLQVNSGDLRDALFRKIGPDFSLRVPTVMPPPGLWLNRGFSL